MVDAGPEGVAVAVAHVGEADARGFGSPYLGAGWKLFDDAFHPPPDISCAALEPSVKWAVAYQQALATEEHNNVTEMRSCVAALRRLVRNRSCRRRRVLVATDSLVALGTSCKGRSSSRPLLFQVRRIAALALFADLKPIWAYVPSEWNMADGATRGGSRAGVHHETASKAESRGRRHIADIRGPSSVVWQ